MQLSEKPTTSTVFFLPPSGCSKALECAIKKFRPTALEYKWNTVEGASGMCIDASGEFIDVLEEFGLKGQMREFIFHPMHPGEEQKMRKDKYLTTFPFDRRDCAFHFVVKTRGIIVDWTARQFGCKNPFPAIWREP
jgi:hypothetical protein